LTVTAQIYAAPNGATLQGATTALVVNGVAQPFFRVQRRKYRFRILNGCNARFLELKLSTGQPFLRIGKDSWLYPQPLEQSTMMVTSGSRADVIIDFTDAPSEVFLQNILAQSSGRKPEGSLDAPGRLDVPVPFMKFIVEGERQPNSATVSLGTALSTNRVFDQSFRVRQVLCQRLRPNIQLACLPNGRHQQTKAGGEERHPHERGPECNSDRRLQFRRRRHKRRSRGYCVLTITLLRHWFSHNLPTYRKCRTLRNPCEPTAEALTTPREEST
jgi:hypothetical protein